MTDLAYKDTLIGRLRGPHVNPLRTREPAEIDRLQKLCLEAADDNERLRAALAMISDSLVGQKSAIAAAVVAWANEALGHEQNVRKDNG